MNVNGMKNTENTVRTLTTSFVFCDASFVRADAGSLT